MNTCNTEGYEIKEDYDYISSDLKFIPFSDNISNMLNSYYIRPTKYIPSTGGFVDSLYRKVGNLDKYAFMFPINNPDLNITIHKTYDSMFREIPTTDKDISQVYEENRLKDKQYINELFPYYSTKIDSKILLDDIKKSKKNVCSAINCPVGKKVYSNKRDTHIFPMNKRQAISYCCGPI